MKNPRGHDNASRLKRRTNDPVLKPFMFLFAAHRLEMWWYEVIETVRRLTMTGLLVLFKDDEIRLAVGFFLSFLSILLHMTTEPFTDPATNTLALVGHMLVFMVFFVAQQITTGVVTTDNIWAGIPLVMLLLTPPSLMVHIIMTQSQRDQIKELRRRERDVQAKEMDATLNQLKDREEVPTVRNAALIAPRDAGSKDPPCEPAPPPPSLNISMNDVNFEKCNFPCYVMSLTNLCGLDKLPLHEAAKEAGLLEILSSTKDASNRNQDFRYLKQTLVTHIRCTHILTWNDANHSSKRSANWTHVNVLTTKNAVKSHELTPLLLIQVPNSAFTYLVSHNWESADHPDNNEGTKLRWLKNMKAHLGIHTSHEMWIWFDVFSIPRKDRQEQIKAISSLPHYAQLCTRILPLVRDVRRWEELYSKSPSQLITGMACGDINTYYQRGWCRPEIKITVHLTRACVRL